MTEPHPAAIKSECLQIGPSPDTKKKKKIFCLNPSHISNTTVDLFIYFFFHFGGV